MCREYQINQNKVSGRCDSTFLVAHESTKVKRAVLLVLTEEFDLVLKVSLDGQSLQDTAQ